MCSFSETFRQGAKQYFQSAFKILQIVTNNAVKREKMMKEWRKNNNESCDRPTLRLKCVEECGGLREGGHAS